MAKDNTVLGIDENIEALLCYAGIWITGIVFLAVEKENKFVRFHAMQSLVAFLALFILGTVLGIIPILGWIVSILLTPLGIILWLFLMYKAYSGELFKLPLAGDFASSQIFGDEGDEDIVQVEPEPGSPDSPVSPGTADNESSPGEEDTEEEDKPE